MLDERARRLLLGAGARQLGRGGIKLIAAAAGAATDTVGRGAAELEAGIVADGRVRAKGAGRKPAEQTDPELWPALDKLVDPETRGDPMSPLRWTTKSTAKLADELTAQRPSGGDPTRWPGCSRTTATACRATPRRSKASSTPTATPSSATSTTRSPRSSAAGLPVISVDYEKEGTRRDLQERRPGVPAPGSNRYRPTPTTSSARAARRCPTGCTTWARTPAGSTSAPTPTPGCSRSSRSAAGGARSGDPATRTRAGC